MQARLLDLGSVTALRSQSVGHAVAAAMRPGSEPAVVLQRPATPAVLPGPGGVLPAGVDPDLCRRRGVPLVRRRWRGEPALVDDRRLLVQVILPTARSGELRLPASPGERCGRLAEALVAAHAALGVEARFAPPRRILAGSRLLATLAEGELRDAVCLAGEMVLDRDDRLRALLRAAGDSATGDGPAGDRAPREAESAAATTIWRETGEAPAFPAVAEELIGALESSFGLELIPSMPRPDEMEGIYEWDRRLAGEWAGAPVRAAVGAGAGAGGWRARELNGLDRMEGSEDG